MHTHTVVERQVHRHVLLLVLESWTYNTCSLDLLPVCLPACRLKIRCDEYSSGLDHGGADAPQFLPPVPREGVMQVSDKVVSVFGGQRHERPAHENELDLVNAVTKLAQLIHSSSGLWV